MNRSETEDSPEVNFNWEDKSLTIKGNSYPENCSKIYEPIIGFIENYNVEENKEINIVLFYNLINSTSTVYIAQIIVRVAELKKEGLKVSIKWCYDEYDEELLELGQKLSSISGLEIEYVSIKDTESAH